MLLIEVSFSILFLYLSIHSMHAIKVNSKYFFKCFIITIILCYSFSLIHNIFGIILSILIPAILLGKDIKNYKKTFFISLTAVIIQIVSTYITSFIFQFISESFVKGEYNNVEKVLSYFFLGLISYTISKIICYFVNFRNLDFSKKSMYVDILIISFLSFMFIIYFNLFNNDEMNVTVNRVYTTLIVLISISLLITLIIGIRAFYNEKELQIKKEELLSLQNYITQTEHAYIEMRKFKHDYINIISSIAGYIYDKNFDGLEIYFEENIAPMPKVFNNNTLELTALNKITLIELKGLLTIKIIQAQEKKIKIKVDIVDYITELNWDTISMCRGLGILIDNAIEAAEISERKEINLGLICKKNEKIIIIQNSYFGNKPKLSIIYNENFSSKGENRGMGLKTLREIISREKNIILETKVDEVYFTQIMRVK